MTGVVDPAGRVGTTDAITSGFPVAGPPRFDSIDAVRLGLAGVDYLADDGIAGVVFLADRLAKRLSAIGLMPVWPVEANEVFVALPLQIDARLKAAGASYHPWTTDSLPNGVALARDVTLVRLVTSFATTADEVDRFVAFAGAF